MKTRSRVYGLILSMAILATGCVGGPVGNKRVPEPARAVAFEKYQGLWYEIGRYENSFEENCEAVTAEYKSAPNNEIAVINRCRQGSVSGSEKVSEGRAKPVDGSNGAKLKVSFFGPFFFGDYWVLDHAEDYSWSIVGEPSGRFLWLLSRAPKPAPNVRETIEQRARVLGYDLSLLRVTKQP